MFTFQGGGLKKNKEKRRAEIFHAGEHGVGISPKQGDKLALHCLSPFSTPGLPGCRGPGGRGRGQGDGVGTRGTGWGPGAPIGPDRTAGCVGTCHEGAPRAQGCGCLQLGLQTDTSLTFSLALPGCLAPLPFGLKPSQCSLYTAVALPQSSSLLKRGHNRTKSKKVKKGWSLIDMR